MWDDEFDPMADFRQQREEAESQAAGDILLARAMRGIEDQLHEAASGEAWTNAPDGAGQWTTGEPITLESLLKIRKKLLCPTLPCLHCQRQVSTLGLRPIKLAEGVNDQGEPVAYWSQECTDEIDCRKARLNLFIPDRVPLELRWP